MDYIVILIAKLIGWACSLLGGGTNLPGQIALKMRPAILKRLVCGYRVVLITGTNGKTTTTAMLQSILKQTGKRAISSASGANMKGGVVSCLLKAFPLFRKVKGDYAVLEVDEAYMRHITAEISPEVIAVTNIFCDQLDRYGTMDQTLSFIEEACKNAPDAMLVLNGDEALFGDFLPEQNRFYYGFAVPISEKTVPKANAEGMFCKACNTEFSFAFSTFNHLGDYACKGCGFHRPKLQLAVEKIHKISADASLVTIGGAEILIPQAGTYNVYNALCAAACATVLGASNAQIAEGIAGQKSKFGRQETMRVENADVRMILVKNPAGASEAISSCLPDRNPVSIGILLNDNVGDGKDVSWIYDVEFERLSEMQVKSVLIGGTRAYDMAVRMQVAGFKTLEVLPTNEAFLEALRKETGRVYLLVTYSAMTGFRKLLHQKKYIQKLWE